MLKNFQLKIVFNFLKKLESKKSKMWESRFQVDLTKNSNLFLEFLSLHYIHQYI